MYNHLEVIRLLTIFKRVAFLDHLGDPNQLSRHLDKLSSTDHLNCMVALILQASTIPSKKELIMSLSGPMVMDVMEKTWVVRSLFKRQRSEID